MRIIDADALIDELTQRCCNNCIKRMGIKNGKQRMIYEIGDAPCKACEVDDMKVELDDAPTIEAEPVRRGVWIENDNGTYSCSECKSWIPKEQHYYAGYCLHCGAKLFNAVQMYGVNDETD